MSKFDELKKAAEAAIEQEDCDRFIERDDAQAVLDLLAIQTQLVEALTEYKRLYEEVRPAGGWQGVYEIGNDALAAAGAQP